MKLTNLALAFVGAVTTVAANERAIIPALSSTSILSPAATVTTSKVEDTTAMIMNAVVPASSTSSITNSVESNVQETGIVTESNHHNRSTAATVTFQVTATIFCTSSQPASTLVVTPSSTLVTITECECTSSTAVVSDAASSSSKGVITIESIDTSTASIQSSSNVAVPPETVTPTSAGFAVTTEVNTSTFISSDSSTTVTQTKTESRILTKTVKTNSSVPAKISTTPVAPTVSGTPILPSTPHSVLMNGTASTLSTDTPTGTVSKPPSATGTVIPLFNGVAKMDSGSASFAIIASSLLYLVLCDQFI